MFHKKIRNFILFLILCTTCVQLTYAQEIRVIDNKGTLKKVNNNQVFEQATDPNPASPATPITVENDIWIDNSTTPNQIKIWDGTTWKLINDNSTHTGTTGELFFADTDGTPTGDPQMFWDKTNTRLFIGPRPSNTTNPSYNNELNILGATRTSGLNNSNGTQGTPSFRFTSDKNTGMFSPTSTPASAGDLLAFTTGGTEALRIDETQQVNVHKDLSVVGAYKDSNGGSGLNGQILSSTATGTAWINNNTVTESATPPTNPLEGDVWFDTSGIVTTAISIRDGNIWRPLIGASAATNWALTGNAATDPNLNFVGTTDAQDLVFKTNNDESFRINNANNQLLVNKATPFNNHPLTIRAEGVDLLAFEDDTGAARWHWNILGNGLNFVESNVADFRLFLEDGGNVGIDNNDPAAKLDINGKIRVRDIATVTTNNDILTVTNTGVVEKKKLIAAETNNQATTGVNGGVYLGPTVYTGFFIITAPNGTINFNQTINNLPFQPSQITFVAHANIESLNVDTDNGVGDNNSGINNSYGTMNGFVRKDGVTNIQQVIYVGGSGNSINDISRFASSTNCIGVRYGDENGNDLGKITASFTTFNTDGFTLNVTRTLGALTEKLVVLYTAYK